MRVFPLKTFDASQFFLTGVNGGVTTTYEPIWDNTAAYTFLAAETTMTISSANANDTSAGTGARTVEITYVTQAGLQKTVVVSMNGQTGVTVAADMLTVRKFRVLTAGSGLTNAGIMYIGTGTVTTGVPAVIHGYMAAGLSVSTSAIDMVPAGQQLLIRQVYCASRSTTGGGHELSLELFGNGIRRRIMLPGFTNAAPLNYVPNYPIIIPSMTQFYAQVLASAGTGPVVFVADCLLLNNDVETFAA